MAVDMNWIKTIPRVLSRDECEVLVLYTGGCPQKLYIAMLRPKLRTQKIALLAFGKPNMGDAGKIEKIVQMLTMGTSVAELKDMVKYREYLDFYEA